MIRISFLGDISFNNGYNNLYKQKLYPFRNTSEVLKKSAFVIGNLECLSSGNDGDNYLKKPRLQTESATLNLLKTIPVNAVTLANNHIYDNLEDGYKKTLQILKANQIEHFGAGSSREKAEKPLYKTIKGIRFVFLNYVTTDTNINLPANANILPNIFEINKTKKYITYVKKMADFVILLLHCGGAVENGYYPDWEQPRIAREMIDVGADLIIGHHSHTIQPYEKYNGKYIFYSLGNFCFDDIIFENDFYSRLSKRHKKSIIVHACFNKDEYSIQVIPIYNNNLSIIPLKYMVNLHLRNLIFHIIKRIKLLWKLYFIKLQYFDPIINYLFVQDGSFLTKIFRINTDKLTRFLKK